MSLLPSPSWQALQDHYQQIKALNLSDLFTQDPARFQTFSIQGPHVFLDYSKNYVLPDTLKLLMRLAESQNIAQSIEDMFLGKPINQSENRAVLHTALRNAAQKTLIVQGHNVMDDIRKMLDKMRDFVLAFREQRWKGFTGQPITDIVSIGIGGSHLGPRLVYQALLAYVNAPVRCHFVSNVDSSHLLETLKELNPENTLFCIASKTFTTTETLMNANTAKQWLLKKLGDPRAIQKHFIAVSANSDKAVAFGIDHHNVFEFWDWVGGRYSLWTAISLPVALAIGMENFEELLAGAREMDEHFRNAPLESNLPVILGLLDLWYRNFFGMASLAVIPYDYYLRSLPQYLQQLMMESNGKSVDQQGNALTYPSEYVVWGDMGTDSQHAFHQLLHQGTDKIPVDFIVMVQDLNSIEPHHSCLFANCLAQSRALMLGKSKQECLQELLKQGIPQSKAEELATQKSMPGNRPSHTLVMERLTPRSLGALLALYEHRTFVQGILWGINSFDQWGVELGKVIAQSIINALGQPTNDPTLFDSSTQGLMDIYRK